jgi:uroporphyrinogen-III synthase
MLQEKAPPTKSAASPGAIFLASDAVGPVRLLVTRPRDDAETLAAILKRLGHEPVIAPLLELRFIAGEPIDLNGVQAILATSANGVRGFAANSGQRNLPVYCVGPQTAEAAREAGFTRVVSANGDASALADCVAAFAEPAKGRLLHAAGAEAGGRLGQSLRTRGFKVDTIVLYEAAPAQTLPVESERRLRGNSLDGVLLYSPRTAKTFSMLVTKANLSAHCANMTAYCISAATAAALSPLQFSRIAVAGAPNQSALLDLLQNGARAQ